MNQDLKKAADQIIEASLNAVDPYQLVKEQIIRRGDILLIAEQEQIDLSDYDRVFLNIVIGPHARAGTMRLTGEIVMPFWRAFWVDSPNVTFTSFGSPYHLYELPHLPNMILAYSACEFSQKAAVKVWLGEIHANGKCPVKLPW